MLLTLLRKTRPILEIIEAGEGGRTPCSVFGVCENARAQIAAAAYRGGALCVVTHQDAEAARLAAQLEALLPEVPVLRLPPLDMQFSADAESLEMTAQRQSVFARMLEGGDFAVVAAAEALMPALCSPAVFCAMTLEITAGETRLPEKLCARLAEAGYARVDAIEGVGQYARRGGILDVFPSGADAPVRIEFFDDVVDSIRAFSVFDQRSVDMRARVKIPPCTGQAMDEQTRARALKSARAALEGLMEKASGEKKRALERLRDQFDAGARAGALFAFADAERAGALDYLPEGALVVVDEPVRVRGRLETAYEHFSTRLTESLADGTAAPAYARLALPYGALVPAILRGRPVLLHALERGDPDLPPKSVVRMTTRGVILTQGRLSLLFEQTRLWLSEGFRVVFFAADEQGARDMRGELFARGVPMGAAPGEADVEIEAVPAGVEYPEDKLVFVSLRETLAAPPAARRRARAAQETPARRVADFSDLEAGDVVVHDQHGLARFDGMVQMEAAGRVRDYLKLSFAGTDVLYVPTDQMDQVRKYIGSDDASPKLNKLGGSQWSATRARVKASVRDMSRELARLYAERRMRKGFAFSPDTPWQREFEAEFPYAETPDQITSIEEIKRDMCASRPMDRLLLGDVGYGKTEVALRAAFKAVGDSRQVAVLVPTTLLAQQHYNTMLARFAHYPVRVQMISRFRTPAQQRAILSDLAEGKVDVVVGTHRLLGGDVVFRDLGLLIVDEEQRFGVAHKEKIRKLKQNVDVLTLSATPIPRTLHMSMTGIRDMSVIDTPPPDRSPVQTYVVEYSDALVRDALLRELSRGGQAYVVYNRVRSIDAFAERVRALVPGIRVAVGHGQMSETALEDVMARFVAGDCDVLVCTTIAENGLDIPNVNTLVVCDADHFGLSQLYQLRGRVGRSPRLAYAYFTYRRDRVMNETAEKRLRAISEYTQFGSGFKIALRDLQIRGAGNLLGAEQHGHLAAVGYELYCRMIEEAVRELSGEKPARPGTEALMDIAIDAFIPDAYIPSRHLKIQAYQRIAGIDSEEALRDVADELIDRYGDLPGEVENLMRVALLKSRASLCGATRVSQTDKTVEIRFAPDAPVDPDRLLKALRDYKGRAVFSQTVVPVLRLAFESDLFAETAALIEAIRRADKSGAASS